MSSSDPTCTNSSMFNAYFGSTLAQYAESADVKVIPGCDNADRDGSFGISAFWTGWPGIVQ